MNGDTEALASITGRIVQKRKRSQWYVLSLLLLPPPPPPPIPPLIPIPYNVSTPNITNDVTPLVMVVYVPRPKRHPRMKSSNDNSSNNSNRDDDLEDVAYFLDSIVEVRGCVLDRLPSPSTDNTTIVTTSDTTTTTGNATLSDTTTGTPDTASMDQPPKPSTPPTTRSSPINHGFFCVTDMTLIQCAPNIRAISVLLRQYKNHHQRQQHPMSDPLPVAASHPLPPISVFIPFPFHPCRSESDAVDRTTISTTRTSNTCPTTDLVHHNSRYFEYLYRVIAVNLQHYYHHHDSPYHDPNSSIATTTSTRTTNDDTSSFICKTILKLQQFILRGLQNQLILVDDNDDAINATTTMLTDHDTATGRYGRTMTGVPQCRRQKVHHRQRIPRISKTELQLLEHMEQQLMRRPLLQIPTRVVVPIVATDHCDPAQPPPQHLPTQNRSDTASNTTCTTMGMIHAHVTQTTESTGRGLYGIDYTTIVDMLFYHPNNSNDNIDGLDDDDHGDDDHGDMCDSFTPTTRATSNDSSVDEAAVVIPQLSTDQFTLSSKDQKSSRGSLTRYDYYLQKKIPQIQYMIQRVLKTLDGSNTTIVTAKHPYRILDVGGGRGDLSILLAYTLVILRLRSSSTTSNVASTETPHMIPDHFHITVVDRNQKSLRIGEQYAKHIFHTLLGIDYGTFITFQCCDFIKDYITSRSSATRNGADSSYPMLATQQQTEFDLIVALHACGDLTDAALYYATQVSHQQIPNRRPEFIICPCCYNKSCSYHTSLHMDDGVPNFTPPYFQFVYPPRNEDFYDVESGDTIDFENGCARQKRTKLVGITPTITKELYQPWIKSIQKLAELSQQFSICRRAAIIINSLRIHYSTFLSSALNEATNGIRQTDGTFVGSNCSPMNDKMIKVGLEEFSSSYSRRNIVIVGSYNM